MGAENIGASEKYSAGREREEKDWSPRRLEDLPIRTLQLYLLRSRRCAAHQCGRGRPLCEMCG